MLLSLTFTDKRLKQSIDRLSFKHRYKPCICSTYCQLVLKLWEYFQYPVTYKLPKVILISIWEVNKVFIDWLSKLLCWGQECLSSCVSNTSLQSSAWQRHIPVRNTWRKIRSVNILLLWPFSAKEKQSCNVLSNWPLSLGDFGVVGVFFPSLYKCQKWTDPNFLQTVLPTHVAVIL